jgi:hypothetical protein
MASPQNYTQASQSCIAQNMYLFNINSAEVEKSFNDNLWNKPYSPPDQAVFINGKLDANGTWYTYTPNSAPLFSNITWSSATPAEPGVCLIATNWYGFGVVNYDCAALGWYVCEYV